MKLRKKSRLYLLFTPKNDIQPEETNVQPAIKQLPLDGMLVHIKRYYHWKNLNLSF